MSQDPPPAPWPKFPKLLMPRDFFPWVLVSGCLEEGKGLPFLHVPGCQRCKRDCNPRGAFMAKVVVDWRNAQRSFGCRSPRRPKMDMEN